MRTILHNAHIYTLDSQQPLASALAIEGDVILAVGDEEVIQTQFGVGAQRLNLGGRPVIPGLTDAHIHLEHYALSLLKIDCETPTLAECLQRIAERAGALPPGEWILGHGWNQNNWPDLASGTFPGAAHLDALTNQHPIYLTAKSLHCGWANSAALKAAGIDEHTPDPPDGEIQRDAHGKPTGILFEGAIFLPLEVIPEPKGEELANALQTAQQKLLQMGITGVHDFDRRDCFEALQRLHRRGDLQLRVLKTIPVEDLPYAIGMGLRFGFGDERLWIGGVKAFADGALGPHTAAMLKGYENEPDNRGMLLLDAEQIVEFGQQAVANGLPLTIHAIGDRANHEVLNAFEKLREFEAQYLTADNRPQTANHHLPSAIYRPLRHRIEHIQLTHPDDAARLAEWGIIASMQPIHATSDMQMADAYWGKRAAHAYAWRTQLQQGAVLAFGSDAPVESPNPFWGLHAAVTRRRADGSPGPEGWYPQQRLSVEESLRAYTQGAAYAAGVENRSGKLSPGYWADLLVLDNDPFTCPPAELRQIRPLGNMIAGEWVIEPQIS